MSAADADRFSFTEHPSIDGGAPDGYRLTVRNRVIGSGAATFRAAAHGVLHWQGHRGAGFTPVSVPDRVEVGAVSIWIVPFGPLHASVRCRVFEVANEPRRVGFGHGTLVGHPQQGWESFVVHHDANDDVRFEIRVVARPAATWMKLAGPFGTLALHRFLTRNLRALDPIL